MSKHTSNGHTPGPWRHDPVWNLIYGPQEQEVCALHSADCGADNGHRCRRGEVLDNATLIAAAPDLLAALKDMLLIDDWHDESIAPRPLVNRAKAAVKKAEGS